MTGQVGSNVGNGYFTSGFPVVSGADLSSSSAVPVDTGITGGAAPQSACIIPGTQPAPATQIDLTALVGGGKAGATQLGYGVNQITTCGTAANSVLLPYAFPGAVVILANDGAAAAQVFGKGTDTVDAVATGTGVALTNATRSFYLGIAGTGDGSDVGKWVSLKGTKSS